MHSRFMTFVDGSNLFGTLKHLAVRVDDYEALYDFIFRQAVKQWRESFESSVPAAAQHMRVYWYVTSAMDDWDLTSPKAQLHLKDRFDEDQDSRPLWLKAAGQMAAARAHDQSKIEADAWSLCFNDFKAWYDRKWQILDGMNRFHHAVEASTSFIEIRRAGRWKVDFLHKSLEEKGLDTSFAVDMVGLLDNYDVALLISGDADGIPSLSYVKSKDKQVGVVEFLKGYPPEKKGRNFASQLKLAADFVVQIYEMELVKAGIARKGDTEKQIAEMPAHFPEPG